MTKYSILIKGQGKILNLDTDDKGNFIAFTSQNAVITNEHYLILDFYFKFPIIRRLDDDRFLIADSLTSMSHIFNFLGQHLQSFFTGECIEDIVIQRKKIVISYFDEGVYGKDGPNQDGLVVFNFNGEQQFGVHSNAKNVVIDDCYCMCKHGTNRILFYPYSSFDVFELNLDNFDIERYETPNDFCGASAISSLENKIFLHSSYKDSTSFFLWDRSKNEVKKFGEYPKGLRGIKNGKFLVFDKKEFTIIDPLVFEDGFNCL